jgi:hypothetical protein
VNRAGCGAAVLRAEVRHPILMGSIVLQTQHFANLVNRAGTCCICVTTSMGVSVMFEDLPWEGTCTTLHESLAREESMSFQVVRHEHPNIFVVNRQTYETYRFTVGDHVMLSFDGAPSDLSKARRTAIAFLAQSETKSIPRR